jgi:ribosomal protein S18 acetylase RimI-like enzyme
MEPVELRKLRSERETQSCAELMSLTEPWLTLGRTYETSLKVFSDPEKEAIGAFVDGCFSGFLLLDLNGPFKGYIQSVCVIPEKRGSGLGSSLISFAEELIFRHSPNVFICYSDFNPRAGKLYRRLGYTLIGELKDYIIEGHSEFLMRKTIGPLGSFCPLPQPIPA